VFEIRAGAGSLKVTGHEGLAAIEVRVEIVDVTGNVSVDDGSGEIDIRRVGGTVTVDDGSGSISIEDVGKDVRIVSAGSGGVDVSGVKGRVIRG
jgi:hypothetical protein